MTAVLCGRAHPPRAAACLGLAKSLAVPRGDGPAIRGVDARRRARRRPAALVV